jgi:hypothetical protein
VKNIDFVYQRNLRNLADGFLEDLEQAMAGKEYVMVILDTLGAVLGLSSAKNVYRQEYQEAIKLQKLAQKYGCCLLIIHHTNKGEGKDAVQRASGSHGLTGAVDSVMLLRLEGGRGVLDARPRDGESSTYHLDRSEDGSWQVTGRMDSSNLATSKRLTPEMEAVKGALADGPKSREQVATALGIGDEAARKRLERMERKGLIRKTPESLYEWVG